MMRRFYWFFLACMVFITSCGLIDKAAGIKRDDSGKVISVEDNPITSTGQALLGAIFGPWGVAAGTVTAAAIREYRHYRIVQSGGKDDDRDGKPDPEKPSGSAST